MNPLSTYLNALVIGAPSMAGPIGIVPLLAGADAAADYLLLDEALTAGLAEITETSDAGAVPELLLRNRAERDLLLLDGEELIGAKQNRVLNTTILAAAGADIRIPVSCVEAGRWAWQSRRFAAGGATLHARARAEKMRGVSAALREEGRRARNDVQFSLWQSVDAQLEAMELAAPTRAWHAAVEAARAQLQAMRAQLAPQPRQVGAAFFVGGRLAGLELFDAAQTFARLLPKLFDSYALDTLVSDVAPAEPAPSALLEVRALLARLAQAPAASYPGVSKGTEVRIELPDLHAAALIDGGRLLHLTAFVAGDSA